MDIVLQLAPEDAPRILNSYCRSRGFNAEVDKKGKVDMDSQAEFLKSCLITDILNAVKGYEADMALEQARQAVIESQAPIDDLIIT